MREMAMPNLDTEADSTGGSDFVLTDLDATHWENLEGLYSGLL